MIHLLAVTITLLPSAVLAEQFTPQQLLDVMTKSPSNRDVRVGDTSAKCAAKYFGEEAKEICEEEQEEGQ